MTRRPTGRPRAAVACAATALLLLAGCSAPLPTPQPDAEPATLPPAVSPDQVDRVIGDLGEVLADADAAVDAGALESRVTGAALQIRQAQYVLAKAGDTDAVTPIPPTAQTVATPTTQEWPRPVMVVTEQPADLQPPLLLTLVQAAPREQYKLWSWVRLFPGVEMPATAQPEVGSAPVAPDADTLAYAPADVLARYIDVVNTGAASPHAALFTEDPLRAKIAADKAGYSGVVGANGSLAETYEPAVSGPYAIATADGGAIVVGAFQILTTITLADSTLTISDQTAALLGKQTVAKNLTISWLAVVAFHVPPAGSAEPVRVLGGERSPIRVTGE